MRSSAFLQTFLLILLNLILFYDDKMLATLTRTLGSRQLARSAASRLTTATSVAANRTVHTLPDLPYGYDVSTHTDSQHILALCMPLCS